MVQKEITFNDGTRIFYEEKNGTVMRFIEYSYSPYEKAQLKEKPFLKELLDKKVRKYNAGKFYYLEVLHAIAHGLNDSQRYQLYNELKWLHDKVGTAYDSNILSKEFLPTFGKYWKNNSSQCAAFFAIKIGI